MKKATIKKRVPSAFTLLLILVMILAGCGGAATLPEESALPEAAASTASTASPASATPPPVAAESDIFIPGLPVQPQYGDPAFFPKVATSWTQSPDYPEQPPISGVNEFPIVEETVDLKVAMPLSTLVADYDTNDLTTYLEALTNVNIVWDLLPQTEYFEKINLSFSSGEALPDVYMSCLFTPAMKITLGSSGLIMPLEDLMEKHTFNHKALLEEKAQVLPTLLSSDGHIYSMAAYDLNEPNQLAMRFWINTDFLEALNMETPTTTEEYYNYLVAVRDNDPNGNGLPDEIPLVGAREGWQQNVDGFLMNAFAYNETNNNRDPATRRRVYLDDNGQIHASFIEDGWKEGLRYMHRLASEGLLSPDSFTLDKAGLRSLVEQDATADNLIVGSLPSGGFHEFSDTAGEVRKHYAVIEPLAGPTGLRQTWYDQYGGVHDGTFIISSTCKIPEIAVKWKDYMYTFDFQTRSRYGILGRDWVIPPDGVEACNGEQAKYVEILKWGTPQNAYWTSTGLTYTRFGSYMRERDQNDPYELEAVLYDAYEAYLPYAFQKSVPTKLSYTAEESREVTELTTLIVEYVEQFLAQSVTGSVDIDAEWDNYLSTIDSMGYDRWIEIMQAAFDRQWKERLGY